MEGTAIISRSDDADGLIVARRLVSGSTTGRKTHINLPATRTHNDQIQGCQRHCKNPPPSTPRSTTTFMKHKKSSHQTGIVYCMGLVLSIVNCGIGACSCQVGTLFASVAHLCAYPTFIRVVSGGVAPDPSPNPACCGRSVPEVGPFCSSASFSPRLHRSLTTRPSADRVRPDWNSAVSGSGELGA